MRRFLQARHRRGQVRVFVPVAVAAVGATILFFAVRSCEDGAPDRSGAAVAPSAAPARASSREAVPGQGMPDQVPETESVPPPPAEEPPDPVPWDALPEAHRPAAVRLAYDELLIALRERWPEVDFGRVEPDCSAAPCLLGLDYGPDEFETPRDYRDFIEAVPGAAAEVFGFTMTAVHVEGTGGGDTIRMHAVPDELGAGTEPWLDLMRGAALREETRRAAVLRTTGGAPPEPSIPEMEPTDGLE